MQYFNVQLTYLLIQRKTATLNIHALFKAGAVVGDVEFSAFNLYRLTREIDRRRNRATARSALHNKHPVRCGEKANAARFERFKRVFKVRHSPVKVACFVLCVIPVEKSTVERVVKPLHTYLVAVVYARTAGEEKLQKHRRL